MKKNKIIYLFISFFLVLSCSNKEPNFILGFSEFEFGKLIEDFDDVLKESKIQYDQESEKFYYNEEYPNLEIGGMKVFKLGLRFDRIKGLEYISISFFHNPENRKKITSFFPILKGDERDSLNLFYWDKEVDLKYFDGGHYEYMNEYDESNISDYADAYRSKIDLFVNIFDLSIENYDDWLAHKNRLNEEKIKRIHIDQIKKPRLVSMKERYDKIDAPGFFICNHPQVSVMKKPGYNSEIVGSLSHGDIVKSLGRKTAVTYFTNIHDNTYNEPWYEVDFRNQKCWIYGGGLESYRMTQTTNDYIIVPLKRVGEITKSSNFDMLIEAYGIDNITEKEEYYNSSEDDNSVVTLFKGTDKELEIYWKDKYRKQIDHIEVFGSQWKTIEGLKTGMKLIELKRINHRDFPIVGPHPHFTAFTKNWNGGKIQQGVSALYKVDSEEYVSITDYLGDKDYESSDPDVVNANLVVYCLWVDLE